MAALVLLVLVIALGVLPTSGRGADSRDPDYGVGPVLRSGAQH